MQPLANYPEWNWQAAAARLGVRPDGRFNAAEIDLTNPGALVWLREDGTTQVLSGDDVHDLAGRIAAVLHGFDVRRGDRVAGFLSRSPTAFALALAVWRLGAVYVPLFSGFGGEGLKTRLDDSGPKVVVTDEANRDTLDPALGPSTAFEILMVSGPPRSGDFALPELLKRGKQVPGMVATDLHDTATLMYTSGTTGRPKGCIMPHRAILNLWPYVVHCLDLHSGETLFSGADPGWSFGLFTTGLAPLSLGASRIIYEGAFDPTKWWGVVRQNAPTHLAAAPTAFRQMAKTGERDEDHGLIAATSAGEPMDGSTIDWFRAERGVAVHDSYGLSELGMVTANLRNPPAEVIAGSMGVPVPGFEVRLVDSEGNLVPIGEPGRLIVKDNGYFLSAGYWGRQPEWDARFTDGWFFTEDIVRCDHEGRYWYVSRADDVIVTAGYNVGPAEVEAALVSHPLIADAACVGEPDPQRGQVVVAHVILRTDAPADAPDDILKQLRSWVGERVGWHAAPRKIRVVDHLPRTASGKVQRKNLREETRPDDEND